MKILITGPESTGKTTLSKELAEFYGGHHEPEYARTFLNSLERPYTFEDLKTMALRHVELAAQVDTQTICFLDTYLLNIKIWAEIKFNKSIDYVEQQLEKVQFKHVLLLKPNTVWEADPLRESPNIREFLFEKFIEYIEHYKWPYSIVDKLDSERKRQAVEIINSVFHEKLKSDE